MPKSYGSYAQKGKRELKMNLPRAILLIGLSLAATGYLVLENLKGQISQAADATEKPHGLSAAATAFMMSGESQGQSSQTADAVENKLQYAAVHVDSSGFRKIISIGTLDECIGLQNAGRTLNLEQGNNFYHTECIPY